MDKNKILLILNIFTRVTTFVLIGALLDEKILTGKFLGFRGNELWAIILIGAVSAIFYIPLILDFNYPKAVSLLFCTVHFLAVGTVVMVTGYKLDWFNFEQKLSVAMMIFLIILIYIIITFLMFLLDKNVADKMNKVLSQRNQEKNQ